MIRAHMTKTHKISLLVTLLLAFVALVSAAFILPKSANAAVNEDEVTQFTTAMKDFVEMDKGTDGKIDKADFFKKEGDAYVYSSIWIKYFTTKTLYVNMDGDTQKAVQTHTDEWTAYQQLDGFLATYYNIYVANTQLYFVAKPDALHPASYANNDDVVAVQTMKDSLATDAEGAALMEKVTDGWKNLTDATAKMAERKQALNDIADLIDKIEYYAEATQTMTPGYTENLAAETGRIVYDSQKTIQDVTDAITNGGYENDQALIDGHEDYEDALAKWNALQASVKKVDEEIKRVHDLVTPGVKYYTVRDEIAAVQAMFDALNANPAWNEGETTDYNDLQNASKRRDDLDEMTAMIASIEAEIAKVERAIGTLMETEAKYTTDYNAQIEAVEAMFDALDEDIKEHDRAKYEDGEYPNEDYFVEHYDDLRDLRAQYEKWDDELKDLEAATEKMVETFLGTTSARAQAAAVRNAYDAMTKEQKDQYGKDKLSKFGDDWGPGPEHDTYFDALTYVEGCINEAYDKVRVFCEDIDELFDGGAYNYADRLEFHNLYETYTKKYQTTDLEKYISNIEKLIQMKEDFDAADALVKAWLATVLADDGTNLLTTPVTVSNWDKVKAAREAFKALDTGTYHATDFLHSGSKPSEVVAATSAYDRTTYSDEEAETWTNAYTAYSTAVVQLEALEQTYEDIVDQLGDIELNARLPLTETSAWADKANAIKDLYDGLLTKNGTTEKTGGAANQEYFQTTYPDEWTKYQEMLTYILRYDAEGKIDTAWTDTTQGTDVQLADAPAIDLADAAYKAYVEEYGEQKAEADIRNADQLKTMKEKLAALTETLDVWIAKVVKLADPDFDETTRGQALRNAVEALLKGGAKEFKGYPLDITETTGAYAQLYTNGTDGYVELIATDTAARTKYFEDAKAKALYDFLGSQSNAVITELKGQVTQLVQDYSPDFEFDSDIMAQVDEMNATYNGMHQSQRELVDNWDQIAPAINKNQAINSFDAMVQNLKDNIYGNKDAGITGENFTSFTIYYINAIKSIYAAFDADTRALCQTAYNELAAIEADYYEAVADKKVVELDDVKAALDKIGGAGGDIEKIYAQIQAINDIINGTNSVQGILSQLNDLKAAEESLEQALNKKIDDFKKELGDRITALEAFKTTADGDIKAAQADIDALQSALGTITNIQDAINKMGGDVSAATEQKIAALRTEVSGQITDLQNQINELKNGDKALQDQIDSLQSDVTALMAVLIVVTVITAGLAVCVVLLFIKRKQQK